MPDQLVTVHEDIYHTNNDPERPGPHRFHSRQGLNIRLSEQQTVATRVSSFAGGLVFSANPLLPNELFFLEIERSDLGWSGSLRIGITQTDPSKFQVVPRFALPDLVAAGSSWVYTLDRTEVDDELGNTLILSEVKFHRLLRDFRWGSRLNFAALQPKPRVPSISLQVPSRKNSYNDEFQARLIDNLPSPVAEFPSLPGVSSFDGSRVGVFYSKEGVDLAFLYFVVNGECRGPFPFELQDGPLFVVCDVYGCTKTVRIVPVYEVPTLKTVCRDAVVSCAQKLDQLPLPPKMQRFLMYQ